MLLDEHALDLMVVIGGYNSSNTCNLARICADRVPTFHIAAPDGLVPPTRSAIGTSSKTEVDSGGGCPPAGPLTIGVTSGASTPDNLVELSVRKLEQFVAAS